MTKIYKSVNSQNSNFSAFPLSNLSITTPKISSLFFISKNKSFFDLKKANIIPLFVNLLMKHGKKTRALGVLEQSIFLFFEKIAKIKSIGAFTYTRPSGTQKAKSSLYSVVSHKQHDILKWVTSNKPLALRLKKNKYNENIFSGVFALGTLLSIEKRSRLSETFFDKIKHTSLSFTFCPSFFSKPQNLLKKIIGYGQLHTPLSDSKKFFPFFETKEKNLSRKRSFPLCTFSGTMGFYLKTFPFIYNFNGLYISFYVSKIFSKMSSRFFTLRKVKKNVYNSPCQKGFLSLSLDKDKNKSNTCKNVFIYNHIFLLLQKKVKNEKKPFALGFSSKVAKNNNPRIFPGNQNLKLSTQVFPEKNYGSTSWFKNYGLVQISSGFQNVVYGCYPVITFLGHWFCLSFFYSKKKKEQKGGRLGFTSSRLKKSRLFWYKKLQNQKSPEMYTAAQKKTYLFCLHKAISNVKPPLECRSKRFAGSNKIVPSWVSKDRQWAFAINWIIKAAQNEKRNFIRKNYTEERKRELFGGSRFTRYGLSNTAGTAKTIKSKKNVVNLSSSLEQTPFAELKKGVFSKDPIKLKSSLKTKSKTPPSSLKKNNLFPVLTPQKDMPKRTGGELSPINYKNLVETSNKKSFAHHNNFSRNNKKGDVLNRNNRDSALSFSSEKREKLANFFFKQTESFSLCFHDWHKKKKASKIKVLQHPPITKRKNKTNLFCFFLADTLKNAYYGRGSAMEKRNLWVESSIANRAFLRYRWW